MRLRSLFTGIYDIGLALEMLETQSLEDGEGSVVKEGIKI